MATETAPPTVNGASEPFVLGDFPIDEYHPMKVVVIGAGYSGITAGIRFPQKVPNLHLTIYEKSAGVGGTWFNNKYPGLACDIPSHCYQFTFESKVDWSDLYAPGPEIQKYLEGVAVKYKVMKYIKLRHEMTHAQFDEATGLWHLRIRRTDPDTGEVEEFDDTANVLFTGIGGLSRWKWPDIEGLKEFKGEMMHSASFDSGEKTWQEVVEAWKDKRVGIIGLGSSAIQLVPALQPRVKKVINYARGKTWISTSFSRKTFADLLQRSPEEAFDTSFHEDEIERFRKDPELYKKFRRTLEVDTNSVHHSILRGHPKSVKGKEFFTQDMMKKLEKKPWIAESLIPSFSVACRRLTPGPGYLEALCEDNVDFVSTPIQRITPTGISLADGTHEALDVLLCATGFDTSFQLPFAIVGRGGARLNERWAPHPRTYLGVCTDGFPNLFGALGPNATVAMGSLPGVVDHQVMFAVRATLKMQRERLRSVEVKREALLDFDEYLEAYFPLTVYGEKCKSWYKAGKEEGRVVALWPGSTLHMFRVLAEPRWEDFNYEPVDNVRNRFFWLGNGRTYDEEHLTGDRAWYLNDDYLDVPPVPEN